MKLYDVPRETYVKVLENALVPPGSPKINKGDVIFFDHLDGMYSLCLDKDKKYYLHLSASAEVEIVKDLKNI